MNQGYSKPGPQRVVFGLMSGGGSIPWYRSAYMGAAIIQMSDPEPPTIRSNTITGPPGWTPDRWVREGTFTYTPDTHDPGLGIRRMRLTYPRRTGGTAQQERGRGCNGTAGFLRACDRDAKLPKPEWSQVPGQPGGAPFTINANDLPEGNIPTTLTVSDALAGPGHDTTNIKTLKVDRSGPEITAERITGPLKDEQDQGLYNSEYALSAMPRDSRSGVEKAELLVDGDVHDTATTACSATQCPSEPSLELALRTDDLDDGARAIAVRTTDAVGNTSTSPSWQVIIDRRGDIYIAHELESEPSPDAQVATEAAQIGTYNGRRAEDGWVSTRGRVACPGDAARACGQVRHHSSDAVGDDTPGETYSVYTRTSEHDSRLEDVASLLHPAHSPLGQPVETGPLSTALVDGQAPPPAHGPTFERYDITEEAVTDGAPETVTRSQWIDAATQMPLRRRVVAEGVVESDSYYDYDRERYTEAEREGIFSLAPPSGTFDGETVTYSDDHASSPPPDDTDDSYRERFEASRSFREQFGLEFSDAIVAAKSSPPGLRTSVNRVGNGDVYEISGAWQYDKTRPATLATAGVPSSVTMLRLESSPRSSPSFHSPLTSYSTLRSCVLRNASMLGSLGPAKVVSRPIRFLIRLTVASALLLGGCNNDDTNAPPFGAEALPVPWKFVELQTTSRTMNVYYFTGPDRHAVGATLRPAGEATALTVYERTGPGGSGLVQLSKCVRLRLTLAVEPRSLVDGATDKRPPRNRPDVLAEDARRGHVRCKDIRVK